MTDASIIAALRETVDTLEDQCRHADLYIHDMDVAAAIERIRDIAKAMEARGLLEESAARVDVLLGMPAEAFDGDGNLEDLALYEQRLTALRRTMGARDAYDEIDEQHRRALAGEFNAPPPVILSRTITHPGDASEAIGVLARRLTSTATMDSVGPVARARLMGDIAALEALGEVVTSRGAAARLQRVHAALNRAGFPGSCRDVPERLDALLAARPSDGQPYTRDPEGWGEPVGDVVDRRASGERVRVDAAPYAALRVLANSRRPIPGEAMGLGPGSGEFVLTRLGPPEPVPSERVSITGDTLMASLWYPRNDEIKRIVVDLVDVRAADSLALSYDFDRDGWSISRDVTQRIDGLDALTGEAREVAFVPAWTDWEGQGGE